MPQPARNTKSHEQHRVLSIRGKSYCNSACIFSVDEIRQLIAKLAATFGCREDQFILNAALATGLGQRAPQLILTEAQHLGL